MMLTASAAKLAALSWDPENLKKLSLNAYLQIASKTSFLSIFDHFSKQNWQLFPLFFGEESQKYERLRGWCLPTGLTIANNSQ